MRPVFTPSPDVLEGSYAVRLLRRVTADSVICRRALAFARWAGRTEQRILAGVWAEWSAEEEMRQLLAFAEDSRIARFLSSLMLSGPRAAWREAGLRRLLEPMLALERPDRVRLIGWMLVVAVLTHTVILAAFGMSTDAVGWGFRAAVGALGVLGALGSRALVAAWDDRYRRDDPAPTSREPS